MELDIDKIEDLIKMLRANGVTKFASPNLSLELGDEPPKVDVREIAARAERNPHITHTPYDHPSLWPSGQRPSFPGTALNK